MSFWRQLTRGMRRLGRERGADRDVADEVQHYLDEATAAHAARGLRSGDALRAAHLELGNVTGVQEQVRSYGWENGMRTVLADLRYAARRLRQHPGFTAVSVITLALGIGASTAIFSAVDPILFAPLPYPEARRVVMVSDIAADGSPLAVTFGTYRELAQRTRSFDAMAVFAGWQPTVVSDAEPQRLAGQRVGAGYFRALGVSPALGRDFEPADDQPNGPHVVVLSDAFWHRRFDGDGQIIGKTVELNDAAFTVIGVMPARFENVLAPSTDVWTPLQYSTLLNPNSREWGHHLRLVARLRRGVGIDAARRELNAIARAPMPEFPRVPWAVLPNGLTTTSLQADVVRNIRPALLAVLGAVLLVLAIACVNVTNLLLARGAQRRGEFAMRAALGAGRGRLVRQLLTESVLLAMLGGAVGIVVAAVGVHALVALAPPGLPRADAIHLNAPGFAFAMIITTVIGVLVGALPALHASGTDLQTGLLRSSRRTAGGPPVTRGALVVAEVALALVLLVSAGLLLRSIERVLSMAVGFNSSGLLTMQVQASGIRFAPDSVRNRFYADTVRYRLYTDSTRYRFFAGALRQVQQVPGVEAAAFTSQLPLGGGSDTYGVHFEHDHDPAADGAAVRYAVTPGYFETMGIPLVSGRVLDARDDVNAPRSVVISQTYARRTFPGADPVGQRLRFGVDDGRWYTIVGVVGDVRQETLAVGAADALYVTSPQWLYVDPLMSLVVRVRGNAAALMPAIRAAVWSVDRNEPIERVATMDDLVAQALADRHFALLLFEAFGATALLLAATGIYGVLAGSVVERTREIGVRAALGASRGTIVALVARQGMAPTLVGVALGLIAAVGASRAIGTLLFGVTRLDPATYISVVVLLLSVSAAACAVPAWRAARVDPVITLRAE